MNVKNIPIDQIVLSPTNPRRSTNPEAIKDLAASVREKGILVPVIVRHSEAMPEGSKAYQLVAGSRRFFAAQLAGLKEIPADIRTLTDDEAREIQIVENLQREDVHPLEEGEAYRKLIEEGRRELADVAAKVGKPVTYVKDRLVLTNLGEKQRTAYRTGKILHGHAQIIARLASVADQEKVLKYALDRWETPSVKDLQRWIDEHIKTSLDNQPWLKLTGKDAEQFKFHSGCKPNVATLFGDVKEGACTSLGCWKKKMDGYVALMAMKTGALLIAGDWEKPPKGITEKSVYVLIGKGEAKNCESARDAIYATGPEIGKTVVVCIDGKCKVHRFDRSSYAPTESEKARRKKELARSRKAAEARDRKLQAALKKVTLPVTPKQIEALLELCLNDANSSTIRSIAKRRKLAIEKRKPTYSGGQASYDYAGAIKKEIRGLDTLGRLRLAFELLIDTGFDTLRQGVGKL